MIKDGWHLGRNAVADAEADERRKARRRLLAGIIRDARKNRRDFAAWPQEKHYAFWNGALWGMRMMLKYCRHQ